MIDRKGRYLTEREAEEMRQAVERARVGTRVKTWRGPGVVVAVYRESYGVVLDDGRHIHHKPEAPCQN